MEVTLGKGRDELLYLNLDLPLLGRLKVTFADLENMHLTCPMLAEVDLVYVGLMSLCEMPSSIRGLSLSLSEESVPLRELFPAHTAESLEEVMILEDEHHYADSDTIKAWCLNGKLRCLKIRYDDAAAGGAFSVDASWKAVPQSLQDVHLSLLLDKGIPRILEQLPSLRILCLRHKGADLMHLDRPLDPFLSMLRLERLELQSRLGLAVRAGGRVSLWTPPALRLLGLAEKRIRQMQRTSPGRTINLIY